jgi:hypothetical protein
MPKLPFFGRGEKKQDTPEKVEPSELEKKCLEAQLNVPISTQLRQLLYSKVIAYLPLDKVFEEGLTSKDREYLANNGEFRKAAAVSMKDERILTDKEFQKQVRGYLVKAGISIDDVEKADQNALYALFALGHECVKGYAPNIQVEKDPFKEYSDLTNRQRH